MDNKRIEREFAVMLDHNEFNQLKKELVGDDTDIKMNGFPYELFEKLDDEQRKDIYRYLLDNLPHGDWRVVAGLGELKNKGVEELLIRKLEEKKNDKDIMMSIHLAVSLWKICRYDKSISFIISVVNNNTNNLEAIKALGNFNDKDTLRLLLNILDGDYYLARSFAVQSILKRIGYINNPHKKSHPWISCIMSERIEDVNKCKNEILTFLKNNLYL